MIVKQEHEKVIKFQAHKACPYYDKDKNACCHPDCILMQSCAIKRYTNK